MLRERLHVGQVVVRTVFLQPFTDILLRPENDGPDQAGLRRTRVIDAVIVTGAVLKKKNRQAAKLSGQNKRKCSSTFKSLLRPRAVLKRRLQPSIQAEKVIYIHKGNYHHFRM